MRLRTDFLLLAATVALACPVLPQDMSDGYLMSNASAVVTSAADGEPIGAVTVTVESTNGTHLSTSGDTGFAVFPDLDIVPNLTLDADAVPQEMVTLSISHPEYVPIRARRVLAEGTKMMLVSLTPKSMGGTSAWITAASGGTFDIPGLGTLAVPPGVLTQDAYLHVCTVPASGQSGAQFEDQLVHQVWLGALDQNRSWIDAIEKSHGGIVLTASPSLAAFKAGTVYAEYWVSRLVDDHFTQIDSRVMQTPSEGQAAIPVAGGSNLVTRSWDPGVRPFTAATDSSPGLDSKAVLLESGWVESSRVLVVELSSRIIPFASTPMRCGEYDNSASATYETSSTTAEVGMLAKVVLGEVQSEIGAEPGVGAARAYAASVARKGRASISLGSSLDGGRGFSADVVAGLVMKKYRVIRVKRTIRPDGVIEQVSTNLGELEVEIGAAVWWNNLEFDASCQDNGGTNRTPPNVPGTKTKAP